MMMSIFLVMYYKNIMGQSDFIKALSNGWRLEGVITYSFEADEYLDQPLQVGGEPGKTDLRLILGEERRLTPGIFGDATTSYITTAVEDAFKIISSYANVNIERYVDLQ